MQNNRRKNIIYSMILLLVVFGVFLYRQHEEPPQEIKQGDGRITVDGKTMGTTYRLVYLDLKGRDFKDDVDSLLIEFNQSLSTYLPNSELSRFNRQDSILFESPFFLPVLKKSKEVYLATEGAFDPTVGPLVNAWGFGPDGVQAKDSVDIKSLLSLVGYDAITFNDTMVRKDKPGMYLDFSAIAKGYAVDVVTDYLLQKGVANILVEIGGELMAKGHNDRGELWKVGINRPDDKKFSNDLISVVALNNKGMATSGNYRNFYVEDSVKYSHTIDPFTGYPVQHGMLSATVVAEDCMTADAYATAMMVMGVEQSKALLSEREDLEAYLIYNDDSGEVKIFVSDGLKPYVSDFKE